MPWTRAASAISTPKRRASSSPACGPAPVTTVPVTRAIAVSAATPTVCRLISGETGRTATPSSGSDGAADEHDSVGDEDQRQQHVSLHRRRVEVDEHGDAAEHDLGEDAGHEAERQHGEVARGGARGRASRARRRSRRR